MSFGLSISTDGGELLVDDRFTCGRFVQKITLGSPIRTLTMPNGDKADEYSFSVTNTYAPNLIFWTLPTNGGTVSYSFGEGSAESLYGLVRSQVGTLLVFYPSGTSYTKPEGYVFGTTGLSASSDPFGLRVYKQDGTLAFDSGFKSLLLAGLGTVGYPAFNSSTGYGTTSTITTALPTLPSKPAFFVAPYGGEFWTPVGETGFSDGKFYEGCVRRDATNIYGKTYYCGLFTEDAPMTFSVFNGVTSAILPIINAADYD
jgi:hypothetical protein